jgi:hypothetical protein
LAALAAKWGKEGLAAAITAIRKLPKAFELPCVLMLVFALLRQVTIVRVRLPAGAPQPPQVLGITPFSGPPHQGRKNLGGFVADSAAISILAIGAKTTRVWQGLVVARNQVKLERGAGAGGRHVRNSSVPMPDAMLLSNFPGRRRSPSVKSLSILGFQADLPFAMVRNESEDATRRRHPVDLTDVVIPIPVESTTARSHVDNPPWISLTWNIKGARMIPKYFSGW